VPGHEIIGHVAAVGDDVQGWSVGDRVGGAWHGGHDGLYLSFCVSILLDLICLLLRQEHAMPAKRGFSKCATTEQSMVKLEMAAVRIKFSQCIFSIL
jgi:NADPH:quinone reductase-like Zn-dependent oxidoreductase